MAKSKSVKPVDKMTYEEAFAELESIVKTMEGEQNELEDAISIYERGQALIERCSELLDEAELKVRQLSGEELSDFKQEE